MIGTALRFKALCVRWFLINYIHSFVSFNLFSFTRWVLYSLYACETSIQRKKVIFSKSHC